MRRWPLQFLTSLLLFVAVRPALSQKFQPKTIHFNGDPAYSDQELMAAAGLKKGIVLSYAEMGEHSKLLMDSGAFESLAFKFDGQDLIYQITPSTEMVPIRLENLPLTPGNDLNARLHESLPLFHGKVPVEGGLMDGVRDALQQILATRGIKAAVAATPIVDEHSHHVSALSFSITEPPVMVRVSGVEGVSLNYLPDIEKIAQNASKIPFDTNSSESNLEGPFETFYKDRGYAAVKVQAAESGVPVVTPESIVVPFSLSIQEGKVYRIGEVHLPAGTPMTQAEVENVLRTSAGAPPDGVRLRALWSLISSRYKSKGNLDCKITPHPTFDDAASSVAYSVDIDPGPVYHLGFVKFDNVSDDLRRLLIHNWEMLPGDPFDEGYVADFISKVQQNDPVLKRSLAGVKVMFDADADPQTHNVNVVIRLEKRP